MPRKPHSGSFRGGHDVIQFTARIISRVSVEPLRVITSTRSVVFFMNCCATSSCFRSPTSSKLSTVPHGRRKDRFQNRRAKALPSVKSGGGDSVNASFKTYIQEHMIWTSVARNHRIRIIRTTPKMTRLSKLAVTNGFGCKEIKWEFLDYKLA